MLPSFCTETITRERAKFVERRGALVPDWEGEVETVEISGCSVQPASTVRAFRRSANVESGMTLFAPPESDIQDSDRITYQGKQYLIDGEPQVWLSPSRAVSSMQVHLKRWKG